MSRDAFTDEAHYLRDEIKRLRKSLSELTTSLEVLLKMRGFRIYRKEPSEDLLLPKKEFLESYFEMMKKYSFRLFLREVIKLRNSLNSKMLNGMPRKREKKI